MRHPEQLHLWRPAHRARHGHQLLGHHHRGRLERLARRHHRVRRPDARLGAAGGPDRRLARLRHGRGLDRGHLHGLVQRARRPDLHRQGLHQRGHVDGVRDQRQPGLGGEPHGPRVHPGLCRHRLLRDGHGQRVERLPRLGTVDHGRPAERDEPAERAGDPDARRLGEHRGRDHRHLHRLPGHRTCELHRGRLHQRGHDDGVRHPDELHLGRPAHRARPGHELLRPDHRGAALRATPRPPRASRRARHRRPPSSTPRRASRSPTARSRARSRSATPARPTRRAARPTP